MTKVWSLSVNISSSNEHQNWSPLGWTDWITLQSKGLSRVFSNTTVQKHQIFGTQLSSQSNSHIHTWPLEKNIALTRRTFVGKVMSLLLNMLSRLVITFLPRSKHLLIRDNKYTNPGMESGQWEGLLLIISSLHPLWPQVHWAIFEFNSPPFFYLCCLNTLLTFTFTALLLCIFSPQQIITSFWVVF